MRVVFAVAGNAVVRRFGVAHIGPVAGGALHISMFAGQAVVGELMIETRLIQADDVGASPLMFRMAGFAFRTRDVGRSTMES